MVEVYYETQTIIPDEALALLGRLVAAVEADGGLPALLDQVERGYRTVLTTSIVSPEGAMDAPEHSRLDAPEHSPAARFGRYFGAFLAFSEGRS